MRAWAPTRPMDLGERFWSKVDASGDCWEWTATVDRKGYGQFSIRGSRGQRTTAKAHRFAWEWLVGPIPPGMVLDHQCRNRRCLNPDHLRVVTPRVNSTENVHGSGPQLNRAKTHCPKGHPYDTGNTYLFKSADGRTHRGCRACRAEASTQAYASRKAYYRARYLALKARPHPKG